MKFITNYTISNLKSHCVGPILIWNRFKFSSHLLVCENFDKDEYDSLNVGNIPQNIAGPGEHCYGSE